MTSEEDYYDDREEDYYDDREDLKHDYKEEDYDDEKDPESVYDFSFDQSEEYIKNEDDDDPELYIPFLEEMYDSKKYDDIFSLMFDVEKKENIKDHYKSFPETLIGNVLMFNVIKILRENTKSILGIFDENQDLSDKTRINKILFNLVHVLNVFSIDPINKTLILLQNNHFDPKYQKIINIIKSKLDDKFFIFLMGFKSAKSSIKKYYGNSNLFERHTLNIIKKLLGVDSYI